jgi:outer membrane receptor protein involved in Fe transport
MQRIPPQQKAKEVLTMTKKFSCVLVLIIFTLTLAITINTPLLAQDQTQDQAKDKTKDKTKEQARDAEDEYLQSLSLEELLNLEITTAGKQKEKISDIPASIVVVTREDIDAYGYQSLVEILENIPGLYVTNDWATKNIGVRGFWAVEPQRNLIILVNDVPQREYFSNIVILEQMDIPVEAIDRIEVVRGPMSIMYGSGAFFGVINIKTNIVKEYNPISGVSLSAGSEKTVKLVARASGKHEDFQYSFNGSYTNTHGIDEPLARVVANPAVLPLFGVPQDQTTGGQLESTGKYFNFSGAYKGFSFDTSFSESKYGLLVVLPSIDDGTQINARAFRLNFGYAKTFSDKVRGEAKFGYFMNRWTFDYDYLFSGIYSKQANSSSGYRVELLLFLDPSPVLNMTVGLSYNNVLQASMLADIPFLGFPNYRFTLSDGESMVTQAIYSQVNYKFSDKFRMVGGLRLEQVPEYRIEDIENEGLGGWLPPGAVEPLQELHHSAIYSHKKVEFIPRLALIYAVNENNYFKFLYGRAINRPSFFQSRDLLVYTASSPLKPESIRTFELNYIGNLSADVSVSFSLFHNLLDNLIYRTYYVDNGVLVSYQANVGEMTTNGLELSLNYRPSRKFSLEVSGTYQDTKEKRPGFFENIEPGYSPRFLGYIKASYFFNRETSLAVTGNYVDGMEAYWDHTLINPDGTFGRRLGDSVGGYFLLGANLRLRDMFGTGFYINLRGSNLLDREIRYPTTSNNSNFVTRGTIGRGISFLLSIGYLF